MHDKSIPDWKKWVEQKNPRALSIKTIRPQSRPISLLTNVSDGVHPYFNDKYVRYISENVVPARN